MRYFNLLLVAFALAIAPCLCGCSEQAAEPKPSDVGVGDPASEFEAAPEEADPDNP